MHFVYLKALYEMKKTVLFVILGLVIGCSNQSESNKVILFTNTGHDEIRADYDYYLPAVIDYLDKKSIEHEMINTSARDFSYRSKIKIKDDVSFAMILTSPKKDTEIEYQFGTDVDLILKINEYFNIE